MKTNDKVIVIDTGHLHLGQRGTVVASVTTFESLSGTSFDETPTIFRRISVRFPNKLDAVWFYSDQLKKA